MVNIEMFLLLISYICILRLDLINIIYNMLGIPYSNIDVIMNTIICYLLIMTLLIFFIFLIKKIMECVDFLYLNYTFRCDKDSI